MKAYIEKLISDCVVEINDLKSRIYDGGRRKKDISTEYYEEKYAKIQEYQRQKDALVKIQAKNNLDMQSILLSAYERNTRDNAIIVAFFDNGDKVVYRGCSINYERTTDNILSFDSDSGLGSININKFASINFAFYGTTYENYVPELVDTNGTLVKTMDKCLDRIEEIVGNAVSEISDSINSANTQSCI